MHTYHTCSTHFKEVEVRDVKVMGKATPNDRDTGELIKRLSKCKICGLHYKDVNDSK